jgi:hypothetical protein
MNNEKIEVKQIVLNIEGKEVKLSVEKARELMNALKVLFPDPSVTYPIVINPAPSNPWPYYPWRPYFGTYCGTGANYINTNQNECNAIKWCDQ